MNALLSRIKILARLRGQQREDAGYRKASDVLAEIDREITKHDLTVDEAFGDRKFVSNGATYYGFNRQPGRFLVRIPEGVFYMDTLEAMPNFLSFAAELGPIDLSIMEM